MGRAARNFATRRTGRACRNLTMLGLGVWLGLFASSAAVAGDIELKTVAELDIRVVEDDGREVTKRVPAAKVVPGDVVIYTITARNVSQEPVDNVVISDPVPQHMTYVMGSSEGEGTAITYSVDGGESFGAAEELDVTDDSGARRAPQAKDITNIRWQLVEALKPAESKSVQFRARLD